ncbi:transposase [Aliiglaciecola sp. LCG003]|uniref:transposase n=1 Tax=Aliiglaciecola sp. LCG003 TaxID=3053655 RepID=UPI0025738DE5|nr:transposase [Aliiglaciecola sp. LCG003]WJG08540.1 transposase [Aliiglaciecola sp. LCG003]
MPLARKRQISLIDTPFYHCVSRCVRRAFLCGEDMLTGKSYEYRRQWVEDRLLFLSRVFCIDVCAYAVMSNHTHVVLHVNQDEAKQLSDQEVIIRWQKLHKTTLLVQQFMNDDSEATDNAQQITLDATIAIYRRRLFDISWFMRELNEPIARQANAEDNCTGHFWEGRFKSQALLDEHALAACMVYVDLNPIRVNMATLPETSKHTSIQRRILSLKKGYQPRALMPFVGNHANNKPSALNFDLIDYIQLVETTGRCIAPQKSGTIDITVSPILRRLGIDESHWLTLSQCFESCFSVAAGQPQSMNRYKHHTKRKRILGIAVFP